MHTNKTGTKRRNWKREANCWNGLATIQQLAVAAVARDPNYECHCGDEPYTNGEMCPKCFCIYAMEEMKEMRKRFAATAKGEFRNDK